jgi:hypothetical protein
MPTPSAASRTALQSARSRGLDRRRPSARASASPRRGTSPAQHAGTGPTCSWWRAGDRDGRAGDTSIRVVASVSRVERHTTGTDDQQLSQWPVNEHDPSPTIDVNPGAHARGEDNRAPRADRDVVGPRHRRQSAARRAQRRRSSSANTGHAVEVGATTSSPCRLHGLLRESPEGPVESRQVCRTGTWGHPHFMLSVVAARTDVGARWSARMGDTTLPPSRNTTLSRNRSAYQYVRRADGQGGSRRAPRSSLRARDRETRSCAARTRPGASAGRRCAPPRGSSTALRTSRPRRGTCGWR